MTEYTVASYSQLKMLKHYGKKKLTANLVQKAVKDNFLFDIFDRSNGQYTSAPELKGMGKLNFLLRYNNDYDVGLIKL